MVALLKSLFLGGKPTSSAFQLDWSVIGGALRTAVLSALTVAAVAALQDVDARDWGVFDATVSGVIVGAIDFVRRFAKSYTGK